MNAVTIRLDHPGDEKDVVVEWDDESGIHHTTRIELRLEKFNKPRTLTISINGIGLARESSWEGLVVT